MASDAQINANRRNALRSTGPKTPETRAKSARNSRKHGLRAEREKLAREESIAYEARYFRWSAHYGVESDPEEFLLNANLFLASDMDRVRGAYLELTQSQIDNAEDDEIKEVRETGDLLFTDSRGVPVALFGTRRFNNKKPGGPSWGSETAPAIKPDELMRKLESSAMGCYWILEVLEELLERARKRFWSSGDRLMMLRLLGRNPVDGPADRRVAEVFAASHALRPMGKPFDDLLSDMNELMLEAHVKAVVALWPDLSQRGEKEKARQSLIELVEGEIERVWDIAAEHDTHIKDEPARTRRRKGFVYTKEAEAMRRYFLRAKGSVERGGKVIRQEVRARKADSDAQGLPPVPGKDVISPYDGRPAAWWAENVGGGKKGDLRSRGGRGQETRAQHADGEADSGDCGSGGPLAGSGSGAAVEIGREPQADGTRSVPATSNEKGRGWESVVVEESDVLACGGYLPEKYVGAAGDGDGESAPGAALEDEVPNSKTVGAESEEAERCDIELNAGGASEVTQEQLAEAADRGREEEVAAGGDESQIGEKAPNEANFCDDACIAQHEDIIEVPTNSGGVSGLDDCQTKPILQTKPIPVGGAEAGGSGGSTTQPVARALTDYERRDAWKEIRRREWIRQRAEKEARERLARLNAGGMNAGAGAGGAAGEGMAPQDVRGP